MAPVRLPRAPPGAVPNPTGGWGWSAGRRAWCQPSCHGPPADQFHSRCASQRPGYWHERLGHNCWAHK
eukprot:3313445-Alexandrium_andersonii.AAC.1